jgi:hypothetical protein
MGEKSRFLAPLKAGLKTEDFVLVPEPGCHFPIESRPGHVCGTRAKWMAENTAIGAGGYYCDAHRPAGAVRIPDDALIRRVRLTVDVLLGGASWDTTIAQAEALARLERGVRLLGGYLDVKQVMSQVGRGSLQAFKEHEEGPSGRG